MLNRMLMTTVAAIALAIPAAAQDTTQQVEQKAEQAQQTLEQTGQATGTEGQTADPQAAQDEAEQPPAMAEEPAQEQAPATAQEQPAEQPPAMAEEPAQEQAPATAQEQPAEQPPAMAEEPAEEQAPATAQEQPAEQPPAMAEEQPMGEPAEEDVAATPPPDMQFIEVQEDAQFLANDEVIGKEVVNPNDERVGTIADLVMDQEQKLVGIVLSVGGFLGIGEKWVAVPVEQIDFPSDDQPARLHVAVTEEQLKNAPDFVTKETAQAQQEAEQATQQMPTAPTTAQ